MPQKTCEESHAYLSVHSFCKIRQALEDRAGQLRFEGSSFARESGCFCLRHAQASRHHVPVPELRTIHSISLSLSRISRHIVIHLLAIFNLCNYTPCSQYHWANARSCTYSMKRRFVTGLFLPTFLCQRYAQDSSVTRQSFYVGPKSK